MQCPQPQSRVVRAALFTAGGLLVLALASMGLSSSRQGAGQPQGGAAGSGGGGGGAAAHLHAAGAEKVGAGLLLTCGGEVLLLQRTSKNNFGTWGLPGGNADATDADLLQTATREAREEMGERLPPFEVQAAVLTQRGKRGQKHYTVFVARVSPEDRAAWRPQLNEEHSAWRWFPLAELMAGNAALHPVVQLALMHDPYRAQVLAAVGGQGG